MLSNDVFFYLFLSLEREMQLVQGFLPFALPMPIG